MRNALALIAVGLVTACTAPSGSPQLDSFPNEGYALEVPTDWSQHRERGALMLRSTREPRRTIAIRSVALDGRRTAASVLDNTRHVLASLPDVAQLSERKRTAGDGADYSFTFMPPGANERYRRSHVVLVRNRHVFHIIETVPAGSGSSQSSEALARLVATIQEV